MPIFLTWRLAGSILVNRIADVLTTEGAEFVAYDKLLDARATGPKWLRQRPVAEAFVEVLMEGRDSGCYELGSWVVMPNHVHMVLYPIAALSRIVSGMKAKSARAANQVLNRRGAFWSRDYFDRWVRNSDEEQRIIRYIEDNPVRAGLCNSASDWPYSSAYQTRL
jgi:REP element-mobilizing transposase RayT